MVVLSVARAKLRVVAASAFGVQVVNKQPDKSSKYLRTRDLCQEKEQKRVLVMELGDCESIGLPTKERGAILKNAVLLMP